jgi:hypothetical protein
MAVQASLRREQTSGELCRLRGEISKWSARRIHADAVRQHTTQLASLETTLSDALTRIDTLANDHSAGDLRGTYDYFRELDHQVTLVRRIWRWFADKYDQRDVESMAPLLRAADEVVWSVHAQAHRAIGAARLPTAPLPFIDEIDTPEAIPRDEPARELRPDKFDDVLAATLARLPIPVIGLPAVALAEPWRLILISHEVGHHLQYDLASNRQLIATVGVAVQDAAGAGEAGRRFRAWSQELFADLAGLAATGPGLITGLQTYELGADAHVLDRGSGRYPAPAVRFALLAEMCQLLHLRPEVDLADVDVACWTAERDGDPLAAQRTAARGDIDLVAKVARTLIELDLDGRGTVSELLDLDPAAFGPQGTVAGMAEALREGSGPDQAGLDVVRQLTAASVIAWRNVQSATDDDKRGQQEKQLATRIVERLVASREPGTRAAETVSADRPDPALVRLFAGELPSAAIPGGTR